MHSGRLPGRRSLCAGRWKAYPPLPVRVSGHVERGVQLVGSRGALCKRCRGCWAGLLVSQGVVPARTWRQLAAQRARRILRRVQRHVELLPRGSCQEGVQAGAQQGAREVGGPKGGPAAREGVIRCSAAPSSSSLARRGGRLPGMPSGPQWHARQHRGSRGSLHTVAAIDGRSQRGVGAVCLQAGQAAGV